MKKCYAFLFFRNPCKIFNFLFLIRNIPLYQEAELMPGSFHYFILLCLYLKVNVRSSTRKLMRKLSRLNTRALTIAQPNPLISNPLMVIDVIHIMKPLMTRVNNPRLKTLSGSVRIRNRGRITALITPRKIEPTIAAHTLR